MCIIKKYALIVAAGFFLLGGCGNAVGNPGGSASLSEDSAAETAGSAVEEEAVSWEYLGYEKGILQIEMTNNTDGEIVYSDDHELYQDLGGQMGACAAAHRFLFAGFLFGTPEQYCV